MRRLLYALLPLLLVSGYLLADGFVSGLQSGGASNVAGPGSATDNAVVRFDGTGGKTIQDSGVLIDDSDNVSGIATLTISTTASASNDHSISLHTDAAGFGGVEGLDIDYTTGAIETGDEAVAILVNIDDSDAAATGGDAFGLKVLVTDGNLDNVYGLSVGAVVGPIHQSSGTFANPTTGTNNTAGPADVADMIDGSTGTNTTIFVSNSNYILIGAAAPFTQIEFNIETGAANPGIQPTFGYSTAGSHTFTTFSPIDGTDGFRHTGIVAWDAADLTSHGVNTDTGTFDIKITRTHAVAGSVSLFFAKTAATVVYSWDKDGDVSIRELSAELKNYSETRTAPSISSNVLILDMENGPVFSVTMTDSIDTFLIKNPPVSGKAGSLTLFLTQAASGFGIVTWPASVDWAGGSAVTLTTTADALDILTFITINAGANWNAFSAGLDMK